MRPVIVCLSLLVLLCPRPLFAGDLPPITDIMSDEEFEVTGLRKLTGEELQALREWIEVFVKRDATDVMRHYRKEARASNERLKQSGREPGNRFEAVESSIIGEFNGWSANSLFKLENGQVWQNRRADSARRTRRLVNPKVIINKNLLGKYVMVIPEARARVQVRRIK